MNESLKIELIAAVDEAWGIGCDGQIPWHVAGDMAFFKQHTMGHPLLMGRKTFESLDAKPLPGRPCAVWTHYPERYKGNDDCFFSAKLEVLLEWCHQFSLPVEVIGGESVYRALMPGAERILLSRIPGKFDCNKFFPKIQGFVIQNVIQKDGFNLEIWERG